MSIFKDTMNNKEFLQYHKLELMLSTKHARIMRKCLKSANEHYVIECEETIDSKIGNVQYYRFEITCPRTNFATAYFHLGKVFEYQLIKEEAKT